jgi:hypothetical protein
MAAMKNRKAIWAVLTVIGVITLASLLAPPIRPPKVRPNRLWGVNTVRSVTLTLTNTNALIGAQPAAGR